jgi:hypothetical protein
VHRYGLPHRIITDPGSNFNNHHFWEYCENSGINVRYVSVAHPRGNGQVEHANGMVLDALRKRLHDTANSKGGKWIKELPNALWGLRTQPSKPTGNPLTSWSTAPKQSSLHMSHGIHQQWSITTKASLKTADELTSTDSKKLAAPRPRPISKVPGGYPTLPRPQRQGTLLQCWRSHPPSYPEHGRTTQAQLPLGRSLHSRKGDRPGLLPPPDT